MSQAHTCKHTPKFRGPPMFKRQAVEESEGCLLKVSARRACRFKRGIYAVHLQLKGKPKKHKRA